ncbi:hypothetical protein Lal_00036370 [Lupinus albus]|nr:hypothetical protein Lal_00036370 [Lupinus albus]
MLLGGNRFKHRVDLVLICCLFLKVMACIPSHQCHLLGPCDMNASDDTNFRRKELNFNHCVTQALSVAVAAKRVKKMSNSNDSHSPPTTLSVEGFLKGGLSVALGESLMGRIMRTNTFVIQTIVILFDKRSGLQDFPWKDFFRGNFGLAKEESLMGRTPGKNTSGKQVNKSEPVRKSKRVPKRRVLDGEFSDDDSVDDEIRYLEKMKTPKVPAAYKAEEELSRKQRKLSSVSNMENAISSKAHKDDKKRSRSDRVSEDLGVKDEKEVGSDAELEDKIKEKQIKESVDVLMDSKREMTLTTRQQARLSSKDSSGSGAGLIEFPDGLPPAPPRKQKKKLSEAEQQMKKAEAAQRRKMHLETAAREAEAEAIRKILNQDSSRKKREDKMKKRQEELAQERAANIQKPNTIRYVYGPNGITVTFPEEMGIPSILNQPPISYPPPREKCAAPTCTNPYKYRHSKLNLPICSLQCHKAVEKMAADGTRVQEKMVTDETRVQDNIVANETREQEKMAADETRVQEKMAADETRVLEKMVVDETRIQEKMAADETTVPKKMVADENKVQKMATDESSFPEKMAADGTKVLEKMAADETSVQEKMAADETRVQEKMAADETRVQEKMAADETHVKEKMAADETAVPKKMVAGETKVQEMETDETCFPEKMLTGGTCVPEKMVAVETSLHRKMVADEASVQEKMVAAETTP